MVNDALSQSFDIVDEEAISKELDELERALEPVPTACAVSIPAAAATVLAPRAIHTGWFFHVLFVCVRIFKSSNLALLFTNSAVGG